MDIAYGLITGLFFGAFLQGGEAIRFERQVGAMRLKDMTIVKFLLTAIVVSSIGVHLLLDIGIADFSPRDISLGAQVIGGLLFGFGWAIIGYCPGTSVGALGEGRLHALMPIVGMIVGAFIYAALYPWFDSAIISLGQLGNPTIAQALGVNHWVVIVLFVVGAGFLFRFFEQKNL
ncbi:MAG: YeeE/YedE thiosulfate transporter family protein [Spirochaetales bacterium]